MSGRTLIVLLLLAAGTRLLWALLVPFEPVSDSKAYFLLASNIAEHGTYAFKVGDPSAYWAVGTAAIYAAGFWLFDTGPWVVITLNMLASLISVALLIHLGQLYYSKRAGILAALFFALWPITIQFVTVLNSELFFIALCLAALASWEAATRAQNGRGRLVWLIITGVVFAAACYVRPLALLFPIGLAVFDILRGSQTIFRAAQAMLVSILIMACLIAPWSQRNTELFGERVLISTNFGANFWMGNHRGSAGGYQPLPDRVKDLPETERSDILKAEAMEYVQEDWGRFALHVAKKLVLLHDRETIGVAWNEPALDQIVGPNIKSALKAVSTLYWYVMLAGGVIGIVLLYRFGPGLAVFISPPALAWIYFASVHAIIVIQDRYHMPSNPFIALLFAGGLSLWLENRSAQKASL